MKFHKEKNINLLIDIDRDTLDKTGSPDIKKTVFEKIDSCDIFVCDVTLINHDSVSGERFSPNPNVMIELGYAIGALGWDRIICLNDTHVSKPELLPFDIRGHRISPFDSNLSLKKEELIKLLVIAIGSIINDYDKILKKYSASGRKNHDKRIFDEFISIIPEGSLLDSLSKARDHLSNSEWFYIKWDEIIHFSEIAANLFLDDNLNESILLLTQELDKFCQTCGESFYPDIKISRWIHDNKAIVLNSDEHRKIRAYTYNREKYDDESYHDRDKRIWELQDDLRVQGLKVKEAYRQFILKSKEILFV